MILVDTSVWVDHLRRRNGGLMALLDEGLVVCHPFVIGELALGLSKDRIGILGLLGELPSARAVRHEDALALVQRRSLFGRGIGWVDVHLIASALLERLPLWTLDRRLGSVARELNTAWHT